MEVVARSSSRPQLMKIFHNMFNKHAQTSSSLNLGIFQLQGMGTNNRFGMVGDCFKQSKHHVNLERQSNITLKTTWKQLCVCVVCTVIMDIDIDMIFTCSNFLCNAYMEYFSICFMIFLIHCQIPPLRLLHKSWQERTSTQKIMAKKICNVWRWPCHRCFATILVLGPSQSASAWFAGAARGCTVRVAPMHWGTKLARWPFRGCLEVCAKATTLGGS